MTPTWTRSVLGAHHIGGRLPLNKDAAATSTKCSVVQPRRSETGILQDRLVRYQKEGADLREMPPFHWIKRLQGLPFLGSRSERHRRRHAQISSVFARVVAKPAETTRGRNGDTNGRHATAVRLWFKLGRWAFTILGTQLTLGCARCEHVVLRDHQRADHAELPTPDGTRHVPPRLAVPRRRPQESDRACKCNGTYVH